MKHLPFATTSTKPDTSRELISLIRKFGRNHRGVFEIEATCISVDQNLVEVFHNFFTYRPTYTGARFANVSIESASREFNTKAGTDPASSEYRIPPL